MAFTALQGMKPFSRLMFSAFVIIVCFLACMVLAMIAAIPVFGTDTILSFPTIDNLDDPESIRVLKYFQVIQSLGLFILPPLILGWLFSGKVSRYLHLDKSFTLASGIMVAALIVFVAPFINFTGEVNSGMHLPEWLSDLERWMKNAEDNAARLTEAFLNVKTTGGLLFNLFMIALLPAVGEEFLFRGVIQKIFIQMTKNHHLGIWISAILFSALHLQFYGFIPRMLLGVLFGYLLIWSGSMWLPILAHFLNNGFAVIAMYLIDREMLNPEIETIGATPKSYFIAAISLIFVILFLWLFKIHNKENKLSMITENTM